MPPAPQQQSSSAIPSLRGQFPIYRVLNRASCCRLLLLLHLLLLLGSPGCLQSHSAVASAAHVSAPAAASCPAGSYQAPAGCLPCPVECLKVTSAASAAVAVANGTATTAATTTIGGVCERLLECRTAAAGPAGMAVRRHILVVNLSSREPVGLGAAAGIVAGICLVCAAVTLALRHRRRRRQTGSRQRRKLKETEAEGGQLDVGEGSGSGKFMHDPDEAPHGLPNGAELHEAV